MERRQEDVILDAMRRKPSYELWRIWVDNDREEWSDAAFAAIERILCERGVALPQQATPAEREHGRTLTARRAAAKREAARVGRRLRIRALAAFLAAGVACGLPCDEMVAGMIAGLVAFALWGVLEVFLDADERAAARAFQAAILSAPRVGDLVTVAVFPNPAEAEMARGRLSSDGIEAFASGSGGPFLEQGHPVQVRVRPPDAGRAQALLGIEPAPRTELEAAPPPDGSGRELEAALPPAGRGTELMAGGPEGPVSSR